jgi:hypothetical protein
MWPDLPSAPHPSRVGLPPVSYHLEQCIRAPARITLMHPHRTLKAYEQGREMLNEVSVIVQKATG